MLSMIIKRGGIEVQSATNLSIDDNRIYNNSESNIVISGINGFGPFVLDGVTVTSNIIGNLPNESPALNNEVGITVKGNPLNVTIGGDSGEGNIVRASQGAGIMVMSVGIEAFSATLATEKVSLLGNSIYESDYSSTFTNGGLGIDLLTEVDTDVSPDGQPNTYTGVGTNANDASDADGGPNRNMNFPVLQSLTQNGSQATIELDLDVTDSPTDQYRVEFFANNIIDSSGYGEGQTYLGSVILPSGDGQQANFTLPGSTDLTGKSISATTTAIDGTTDSGFAATSEFSAGITPVVVSVDSPDNNGGSSDNGSSGSLAGTGQNTLLAVAIASLLVLSAGLILSRLPRRS